MKVPSLEALASAGDKLILFEKFFSVTMLRKIWKAFTPKDH